MREFNMTKKLMVPRDGVKVRDPINMEHLPPGGASRHITSYYKRREADGDLEIRDIPKTKAVKTSKQSKNKPDGDK